MKVFVSQEHGKLIDENGCTVPVNIAKKEHVAAVRQYIQEANPEEITSLVTMLLERRHNSNEASTEQNS